MNEVVISQPLLENESYNRVYRRIVDIRRSSELFENYVARSQLEYSKFATKTREDCELFEDGIIKANCFSSRRCQELMKFVKLFKEVAISIQKMTAFNMIGLKGIQNDQPAKLQQLFRRRLGNFLEYLSQYSLHCRNLQKLFSSYMRKCQELKQVLNKCREVSRPTNFYNPDTCDSYQRDLSEKFSAAVAKETAVTKDMQEMLGRKRQLQVYVKEMKDCLVMMVKFHIGKISEMVRIVLDSIAWEKAAESLGCSVGLGPEDVCEREMQKLNHIYNSGQPIQDQFSQQPSFMNRNFAINQIPPDFRFFMERCENYIKMRKAQLEQCCFARKKLKVFLEALLQSLRNLREGFGLIQRECFGGPERQDYKNQLSRYFGDTLSSAFYLVQSLVNTPEGILSRIQQFILTRQQRIFQLINAQQVNCTTFDQNIGPALNQCLGIKQQMASQQTISSQAYVKLSSNIRVTFLHLKAILSNINSQEDTINKLILDELQGIMALVNRQCFMHRNQLKLEKQKGNYEAFRRINVDSEVINILNEDQRYQIMFNNFYTGEITAIHFRSYIDHASYQNAHNLLEKKKMVSINDRNRPFLSSCCSGSGTLKSYPGGSVYKCKLYNQKLIKGKIVIVPEGLHWVSKPILLFGNKSKLVIPKSDIKGFEMKDPDPLLVNAIVIKTEMGDIIFSAFEKKDEVFEHLNRAFPIRQGHMKETGHQTDSRLSSRVMSQLKLTVTDRSTVMNNSKIIIRRPTSSMSSIPHGLQVSNPLRSSIPGTIPLPPGTVTPRDNDEDFSSLVEKWNGSHNFFQTEFVMTAVKRDQNWIRSTYEARFCGIRTILKQLKSVNFTSNLLQFDFKWKVSFPSNPNIKSFSVFQLIKVFPGDHIMRIHILTRKPSTYASYLQDIFYESLKKMDEGLTEFISRSLDKECEVDYQSQIAENMPNNRDTSLRSELRRVDNTEINRTRGLSEPKRQDSMIAIENQLGNSVVPLSSPHNLNRGDSNPILNTVSSEPVLNSQELLQAEPTTASLTNNSVQGRPEQVRMILAAFFVLFLALFLM